MLNKMVHEMATEFNYSSKNDSGSEHHLYSNKRLHIYTHTQILQERSG